MQQLRDRQIDEQLRRLALCSCRGWSERKSADWRDGGSQANDAYVFGRYSRLKQLMQQLAHDSCLCGVGDAAARHDGLTEQESRGVWSCFLCLVLVLEF